MFSYTKFALVKELHNDKRHGYKSKDHDPEIDTWANNVGGCQKEFYGICDCRDFPREGHHLPCFGCEIMGYSS